MRKPQKSRASQKKGYVRSKEASHPIESSLLELLSEKTYVPMTWQDLAHSLQLKKTQIDSFKRLLEGRLRDGTLVLIKQDRYCLPKDAQLIAGTVRFRTRGSAIVIPDDPDMPPYDIAAEDTGVALHQDKVLVRPKPLSRREQRAYEGKPAPGQIIRILQRARERFTGTLQAQRNVYFVIPDDPKIVQDILVPIPAAGNPVGEAVVGDKVLVKLTEWRNRHLNPVGEVIEILGTAHTPDAEFLAILRKYELSPTFPKPVMAEAAAIPNKISAKDCQGRLDCRELFTITVDPVDAKDFDDAISFDVLPDGNWHIGVHIADVAHYVKLGSALDIEAQRRGNSTYLVGTVIPMLPHELSSGLCSLIEGEDRLTKAVFFTFTPSGKLITTTFANTVIRSSKRLSYLQAFAFLEDKSIEELREMPSPPSHQTGYAGRALATLSDAELIQLKNTLKNLWTIADGLRKARMKKGSFDLDMPDVKIYVDAEGYAERIETSDNDISHQLIEEFMLLANESVAKAFFKESLPFISRVHDEPDSDKLDEYRQFLQISQVHVGDLNKRSEVIHLLELLKNHPQGYALRLQLLKSLKQAVYRPRADGHYGLNKLYYAHFTSPIRRYADLTIHRLFDFYLQKQGLATASTEPLKLPYTHLNLINLADHISVTERNSAEAERESKRVKLLEFFEKESQKRKRQIFEATVVDIKNIGLFVELTQSLAFGLVHVSTLKDDLYALSHDGTALVGRRHRHQYTLGQRIHVVVYKVDRFKRRIDFALAEKNLQSG